MYAVSSRGILSEMRISASLALALSFLAAVLPAQSSHPDLQSLYDAHRWFALREAVASGRADLFYKAATEAAFHQDDRARSDLTRYIASHPEPVMLVEAREILLGMDFRSARYQDALIEARQILALKPNAKDVANFLPTLEVLAPSVRQISVRHHPSTLHCELLDQNLILPVTVHGESAHYILDNGFSLSGMSESEAKRLRLSVHLVPTQVDSMSGAKVNIHIAVVPDLALGETHLKNVAFYVFPDDQPPFNQLAPGHRGILGLQVVIALEHFMWQPASGTFAILSGPSDRLSPDVNLAFDGSSVFTQLKFRGTALDLSLDSGAQNTILYPSFARQFPDLQNANAVQQHKVTGVGGSSSIRSLTLPSLEFLLGGREVTLKPATVLLEENNSTSGWFKGNLGMDLLNQARSVDVDFGSMTLSLR
jgi:hypothetical protein